MSVEAPDHAGWQRTLWLMVGVRASMAMAGYSAVPILPLYVIALGVTKTAQVEFWAGLLVAVNCLGTALASPLWGALSDRVGRKVMVVRSTLAVAVVLGLSGLCHNVWQLLVIQSCAGLFGGFSIASMALVAAHVPEERLGFSLGWLATGQLVGALLGPLLGGTIADRLHDYRAVYFSASCLAFIVSVASIAFVRERFVPVRRAAGGPSLWEQLRALLRHPALLPLLSVLVLTQVTVLAAQPIIPLYVRSFLGDGGWLATAAGFAIAVTGLADVLASPWLGKRSDRIGYRRVLVISLIGAAAFTLPQAFAPNYWTFVALRFGVGIFLGGILPAANALLVRHFAREQRGQIFGLSGSATFLGMFLGPLVGGLTTARFGFGALFVLIASLMVVNVISVARLRPPETRRPGGDAERPR